MLAPDLNSVMMASRSRCGMSPCIADTVKLASRILAVNQSTFRFVLTKITALQGEGGEGGEGEERGRRGRTVRRGGHNRHNRHNRHNGAAWDEG